MVDWITRHGELFYMILQKFQFSKLITLYLENGKERKKSSKIQLPIV